MVIEKEVLLYRGLCSQLKLRKESWAQLPEADSYTWVSTPSYLIESTLTVQHCWEFMSMSQETLLMEEPIGFTSDMQGGKDFKK